MKDFVVKFVFAAEGVAEEDADCMHCHEIFFEYFFERRLEDVIEGVTVEVLEAEVGDQSKESCRDNLFDIEFILGLHLKHLLTHLDAFFLYALFPALVRHQQVL